MNESIEQNINELKPCPFCGSRDVELRKGAILNGAVHCKNCTADVVFNASWLLGDYNWKRILTDGWNRRNI